MTKSSTPQEGIPDSTDADDRISQLTAEIQQFVHQREWSQFHAPKEMAVAIAAEAGELMQHFVWKSPEQSQQISQSNIDPIADEIADVAILLFEFADNLNLNLAHEIRKKLEKNNHRYPIEKSKGNNLKYNQLSSPPPDNL